MKKAIIITLVILVLVGGGVTAAIYLKRRKVTAATPPPDMQEIEEPVYSVANPLQDAEGMQAHTGGITGNMAARIGALRGNAVNSNTGSIASGKYLPATHVTSIAENKFLNRLETGILTTPEDKAKQGYSQFLLYFGKRPNLPLGAVTEAQLKQRIAWDKAYDDAAPDNLIAKTKWLMS